jgi:nucleoside phosphorylase
MAFREVRVFEVRDVLRLWVAGEGLRSIERLSRVDRKTVCRNVEAAVALGLDRNAGVGVEQLTDTFVGLVVEAVRPHRCDGHGEAWRLLVARHNEIKAWLDADLTGIGKVAAATVTTEALLSRRDGNELTVFNIGTVGALRDGLSGLFLPSTVINQEMNGDAIRALGYDPREVLHVERGDGTVPASGDVFFSDPDARRRLAERAQLVDMEGYAVAYVCQRLGVPCGWSSTSRTRLTRRRSTGRRSSMPAPACSASGSPTTPNGRRDPRSGPVHGQ